MSGRTGSTPDAWRAAGWLALLAAGQAATLQMIQAGPFVRYQHYVPLSRLLAETPPPVLWLAALQWVAVAAGLVRARANLGAVLRAAPRGWRLGALAAVLVLTSATLSRRVTDYAGELAFASVVQLVHLGNLFLFARAVPGEGIDALARAASRLLGPPGADAEPGGPDRLAWALALWVMLLAGLLSVIAYQRHPHVPDEVAYLFQARTMASGSLALPSPPVPAAFDVDLMMNHGGRWFSVFPPGWPAVLAIGAFLRAPWLVNPVLAGANILLAYVVLREVYPVRTARLATLLLAMSPWQQFLAMSFMAQTFTLTGALAAAALVGRQRRDARLRWAILGGLAIGAVGLARPLDGLVVAALLGLWSVAPRAGRVRLMPGIVVVGAALAAAALTLPYGRYLTGSARLMPLTAYMDSVYGPGVNALGFGSNRGFGWPGLDPFPGHGLRDVLVNADFNLFQINVELLGWASGSLLVIAMLLFSGRMRRVDWLMVAVIATVAGAYSLYWFGGGPDFGARYWYLVIVPCLALAARGIEALEAHEGPRQGAVLTAVAALVAVTMCVFVPWRAADKYWHYRGMRPDILAVARARGFGDAVVLVRGPRQPDYHSAAIYNPLDLRAHGTLYAWDRGRDVRGQLARAYAERRFFVVNGPTVTGRSYEVVAGPLTADQIRTLPDSAPGAR